MKLRYFEYFRSRFARFGALFLGLVFAVAVVFVANGVFIHGRYFFAATFFDDKNPKWRQLTKKELEPYVRFSRGQCMNVLLASKERGYYLNGELVDNGFADPMGRPMIWDVHIGGDRVGYIDRNRVIVDGEDLGPFDAVAKFVQESFRRELFVNEERSVFLRRVSYDAKKYMPTYHVILDGKDIGEAHSSHLKLNGKYAIYQRLINKPPARTRAELYVNGKKVANGQWGDYDGKNLAYVEGMGGRGSAQVIYNGKKVGYGGEITLRDGHFSFKRGETPEGARPRIIYDGKDLGRGHKPFLEKDHIAFLRSANDRDPRSKDTQYKVIYDGKELDYIGGVGSGVSLAGDHVAYVRRVDDGTGVENPTGTARINIDGKDFPVEFSSNDVYVEITEKVDRRGCS